jgi:alpha-1,3/alpha-1,6-mannosyltransferase
MGIIGNAHRIVVNSGFTKKVFKYAFSGIAVEPEVVYPGVKLATLRTLNATSTNFSLFENQKILLSINRFERKKNVAVAIRAYARLMPKNAILVVAGMRTCILLYSGISP